MTYQVSHLSLSSGGAPLKLQPLLQRSPKGRRSSLTNRLASHPESSSRRKLELILSKPSSSLHKVAAQVVEDSLAERSEIGGGLPLVQVPTTQGCSLCCMGLQPLLHGAAASVAWGCSPYYAILRCFQEERLIEKSCYQEPGVRGSAFPMDTHRG